MFYGLGFCIRSTDKTRYLIKQLYALAEDMDYTDIGSFEENLIHHGWDRFPDGFISNDMCVSNRYHPLCIISEYVSQDKEDAIILNYLTKVKLTLKMII